MRSVDMNAMKSMAGDLIAVEVPVVTQSAPRQTYGTGQPFDLLGFLAKHGIQHRSGEPNSGNGGGTKYTLLQCPFDSSHVGQDASVFYLASGALGFKCFHASCSNNRWDEFRQLLEPSAYDRPAYQPPSNNGTATATREPSPAESHEPPQAIRSLMAMHTQLREPIIHGLLRRGETMNIIAPPKTGKSWLVNQLALKCTTGGYWHGRLVERGNVLILDNELHEETTANRLPRVAEAMKVSLDDYADSLFVKNLRGKSWDIFMLRSYFEQFKPRDFSLIILDAFYRFLPKGYSENDNAQMTELYNAMDRYAAMLNCAFVAIHHTSKGNQSNKSVTDTGSGAGSQSRAADTHLVLRPHANDGVVVMEAVTRSWQSPDPVCLKWEFPLWSMAEGLDPLALKDAKPSKQASDKPSKFEKQKQQILQELVSGPKTKNRLKTMLNTNGTIINDLLDSLLEAELIQPTEITTSGGNTTGYELNKTTT